MLERQRTRQGHRSRGQGACARDAALHRHRRRSSRARTTPRACFRRRCPRAPTGCRRGDRVAQQGGPARHRRRARTGSSTSRAPANPDVTLTPQAIVLQLPDQVQGGGAQAGPGIKAELEGVADLLVGPPGIKTLRIEAHWNGAGGRGQEGGGQPQQAADGTAGRRQSGTTWSPRACRPTGSRPWGWGATSPWFRTSGRETRPRTAASSCSWSASSSRPAGPGGGAPGAARLRRHGYNGGHAAAFAFDAGSLRARLNEIGFERTRRALAALGAELVRQPVPAAGASCAGRGARARPCVALAACYARRLRGCGRRVVLGALVRDRSGLVRPDGRRSRRW